MAKATRLLKTLKMIHHFNILSAILGQPNFCEKRPKVAGWRRVRKVNIHPHYRAKKGKGKMNMPIYDFALIEVTRDMRFSEKVHLNEGHLFRLVLVI